MNKLEKKYLVEEKHRGEWKPLHLQGTDPENPIQKHVITEERFADALNIYADVKGIRYVLAGETSASKNKAVENKNKSK